MIKKDYTGQRHGRLVVLGMYLYKKNRNRSWKWVLQCDCGSILIKDIKYFHNTYSCGCLIKDRARDLGKCNVSHGQTGTRLYHIWMGMKARCLCETNKAYSSYGGRGISICKEWADSFEEFHKWAVASGYDDTLIIDRENNDGNYEPSNCRWVTYKVSANNRRKPVSILTGCREIRPKDLANMRGIPLSTLYAQEKRKRDRSNNG